MSVAVLFFSEAKSCLIDKHIVFLGDSRIRQLFYSFIKIINPQIKEEGNKVRWCISMISVSFFSNLLYNSSPNSFCTACWPRKKKHKKEEQD